MEIAELIACGVGTGSTVYGGTRPSDDARVA